jgi:uncharacterized SAM-binding protein YcdF (DUF218 family)
MANPKSQKPPFRIISGCVLAGVGALALLYLILLGMGGFLIEADTLEKADALVVLSGGDPGRLDEAIRLYQAHFAQNLILTRTTVTLPDSQTTITEDMRQYAVKHGVASGDIQITDREVSSTYDEAEAVSALAQANNYSVVILVTGPYHTRRTGMIFRDVFANQNIRVIVRPVPGHWFRSNTWFLSIEGLRQGFSEYFKILMFIGGIRLD